nr:hypothetical protein [Tanacetum cinerariifolium]
MILESVKNGPLIWPPVEENGETRTKKYAKLSATEKIQVDCDMKATNIILQGLPADIYSLVNHHRVAKDLWERVQLLMQFTSLTKQERECKLYDAFDKFTHIRRESLHKYYLRFTQLINDMNIYNVKIEQFQVNMKFLNSLPPEWRDDPIAYLNKAMAFLTAVASSRFPSTNNQLLTSSNPRNQATIQDGRSQCNKFRGDKVKVILVQVIRVMLLVLREIMQMDRQGLLNATTVKYLDTYDFDYDDISNAKVVLMANISNYGFDVISEEKANKEQNNESLTAELERYKERVKTFEQRLNIDLSYREKMIDSQMDDMIKEKLALKEQVDSLE